MTNDEGGGPRIVDISQKNELRGALERLERGLPDQIRYAQLKAKIWHSQYTALVEEGFSEAQAIDLCWRS